MRVTIEAKDGRFVSHEFEANEQGDVERAISIAFDAFRTTHKDTVWETTIRLEHA